MARLKSKGLMRLIKDYVGSKLLNSLVLWGRRLLSRGGLMIVGDSGCVAELSVVPELPRLLCKQRFWTNRELAGYSKLLYGGLERRTL